MYNLFQTKVSKEVTCTLFESVRCFSSHQNCFLSCCERLLDVLSHIVAELPGQGTLS